MNQFQLLIRILYCADALAAEWGILMKKHAKILLAVIMTALLVIALATTCLANGDVAGAIEQTWDSAKGQIKQVVNNVVFPVIDLVLAVCFFAKVATAYMDYRKHGQFEFTAPAILFGTLVFSLTAPLYIWKIIGI